MSSRVVAHEVDLIVERVRVSSLLTPQHSSQRKPTSLATGDTPLHLLPSLLSKDSSFSLLGSRSETPFVTVSSPEDLLVSAGGPAGNLRALPRQPLRLPARSPSSPCVHFVCHEGCDDSAPFSTADGIAPGAVQVTGGAVSVSLSIGASTGGSLSPAGQLLLSGLARRLAAALVELESFGRETLAGREGSARAAIATADARRRPTVGIARRCLEQLAVMEQESGGRSRIAQAHRQSWEAVYFAVQ